MTQVGNVYGESLYELAKDENLSQQISDELSVLNQCFVQDPDFIRLLSSPSLSKAERCQVLDESFRGKIHPYLLNFLKILTEKGYMRFFSDCHKAYMQHFDDDNGILRVCAVTALPMTSQQTAKLAEKLSHSTGKVIKLQNKIDPSVLGGVRLDYDGQRLDDTVSHRMQSIRELLSKTVL